MANVPNPDPKAVQHYLATLKDAQTLEDSETLIALFNKITGHDPVLWHTGIIGFDSYHYKYDSGREGDAQALSFYPRDGKITIYLMDGTARYTDQLAKLGKHTTSRVCLYIKRLSDIDLKVLEDIAKQSYAYIKSQDGQMHRTT